MKVFKKIILLTISVIMLIALCSQVIAADSNSPDANVSIECVDQVNPSDELTVSINIKGTEEGIMGVQAKLEIDNNIFEVQDKSIQKDGWMISMYNEETNMFLLEVTDEAFDDKDAYIYDNEQMVTIKLKVKEDAKPGKASIKITDVEMADSNYETLQIDEASHTVTVSGFDINVPLIIGGVIVIIAIIAIIIIKKRK